MLFIDPRRPLLLLVVALASGASAFVPRSPLTRLLHAFDEVFSKPTIFSATLAKKTDALLAAVSEAEQLCTPASEEAVRELFSAIEASFPAPGDLLDDSAKASALAGEWRLRYTVAAFGAPLEGGVQGVQGSVNATGISVDTTGEGVVTTQTFDLGQLRVANDILTPGPLGLEVRLQVAGPFSRRSGDCLWPFFFLYLGILICALLS